MIAYCTGISCESACLIIKPVGILLKLSSQTASSKDNRTHGMITDYPLQIMMGFQSVCESLDRTGLTLAAGFWSTVTHVASFSLMTEPYRIISVQIYTSRIGLPDFCICSPVHFIKLFAQRGTPNTLDSILGNRGSIRICHWDIMNGYPVKGLFPSTSIPVFVVILQIIFNLIHTKLGGHIFSRMKVCNHKQSFGSLFISDDNIIDISAILTLSDNISLHNTVIFFPERLDFPRKFGIMAMYMSMCMCLGPDHDCSGRFTKMTDRRGAVPWIV